MNIVKKRKPEKQISFSLMSYYIISHEEQYIVFTFHSSNLYNLHITVNLKDVYHAPNFELI